AVLQLRRQRRRHGRGPCLAGVRRGSDEHERDQQPNPHHRTRALTTDSISSAALSTFELASYARWPRIMLTISSTTLTLESSTKPCASVPRESAPGTPVCGSPDAVVAVNRLPPIAIRPAGF